jgi:2,3-bisphosphoglycerate-dependent phosphoglycerate mutase
VRATSGVVSILLVRHGETAGNVDRVLQRADVPLNERGRQQAQRLAARLAEMPVARVVSSDLERARMTTGALCERLPLTPMWTPLLAERNFGDLRGTPYDQLPSSPFAPDFQPPGGEGWLAFHARVAEAFAWVLAQAAGLQGHLVVVTHGLVCRAIAQRHIVLPTEHALPERFGNTSVTLFDRDAPHRVTLLDCTAHLGGEDARAGSHGAA